MRARAWLVALSVMLGSMLSGAPSQARNSTGAGTWLFACNITLAFPVAAKTAAKTNCRGDAFGAGVTAEIGAPLGIGIVDPALEIGSADVKDATHNFMAYNVEYNETCVGGEPLPLIGSAQGHAQIVGKVLPGLVADRRTHSIFQWTRAGVTAVALLFETHREAGGLSKTHKTKKGGAVLDPKAPPLPPDNVALAVFEAKQPVGSCALPNPQQAIEVVGVVVAAIGLNEVS